MRTQLIEQTGKPYKLAMLLGGAAMALGAFTCAADGADDSRIDLQMWLIIGGFLAVACAKGLAWWNHG